MLLFAIVLGLTALASSVAPPPREDTRDGNPAPTTAAPPPPAPAEPVRTLTFGYPPPGSGPGTTRLELNAHAVVTVRTSTPGEASIPKLGLTDPAEPATPASFDVLLTDPGRYDVLFASTAGKPSRLGTLVVGE